MEGNMGKTIAARLREYALAPLMTNPWDFFVGARENYQNIHRYFADEIEREYIPKPRLSGKPIEEGDFVCNAYDGTPGKVKGLAVIDGVPSVLIERQGWYREDEITAAVLDANGIPFKKGETVYSVKYGKPCKVHEVVPKSDRGTIIVCIRHGDGLPIAYPASFFTHEEPVSLDGLLDYVNEQADKCGSMYEPLNEIGRQLNILIERNAPDGLCWLGEHRD